MSNSILQIIGVDSAGNWQTDPTELSINIDSPVILNNGPSLETNSIDSNFYVTGSCSYCCYWITYVDGPMTSLIGKTTQSICSVPGDISTVSRAGFGAPSIIADFLSEHNIPYPVTSGINPIEGIWKIEAYGTPIKNTNPLNYTQSSPTTYIWTVTPILPKAVFTQTPQQISIKNINQDFIVGGLGIKSYKYKLDGGSWSQEFPISSKFTIPNTTSSGLHTVYIIGSDSSGNWQDANSPTTYTWTLKDISTPPSLVITSKPSNITNNISASFSFKGADLFAYKLDNDSWVTVSDINTGLNLDSLSDGKHTIKAKGINLDGTIQSSFITYMWIIDTTAPIVILINTPPDYTTNDSINVSVGLSEVVTYKYSIDGQDWSNEIPRTNNIALTSLSSGKHILKAIGCDTAGNWQTEENATIATWIQQENITLSNVPRSRTSDNTLNVAVLGNVQFYKYILDSNPIWSDYIQIDQLIVETDIQEGVHVLEVVGYFYDGTNYIQASSEYTYWQWTVDLTGVVAIINNGISGLTDQTSQDIIISGDNVLAYKFRLDGANWSQEKLISEHLILTNLVDGIHKLEVIGRDDVYNYQSTDTPTTLDWIVDNAPVIVSFQNLPDLLTNINITDITVSGADTYEYSINDSTYILKNITDTISLSGLQSGLNTIKALGINNSGKRQIDPTTYTWTIDITPPVAIFVNPPTQYTGILTQSIRVAGTDVISYKYQLDTNLITDELSIANNINETVGLGKHTLSIWGKDLAGNWQVNPTITTWVIQEDINLANLPDRVTNINSTQITVSGLSGYYKCRLSGSDWSDTFSNGIDIALNNLTDGNYTLEVIGMYVDETPNYPSSQNSETYNWIVDTIAPVANLSNFPIGLNNIAITSINVNGDGVDYYKYQIDNNGWSEQIDKSTLISIVLSEGYHYLEVIGGDQAGNWQDPMSPTFASWTTDTTAPIITATPAGESIPDPIDVTLSSSEEAKIYYSIDGTNPSNLYINPLTISNNTALKFFGIDNAGNSSAIHTENYRVPGWYLIPGTAGKTYGVISSSVDGSKSVSIQYPTNVGYLETTDNFGGSSSQFKVPNCTSTVYMTFTRNGILAGNGIISGGNAIITSSDLGTSWNVVRPANIANNNNLAFSGDASVIYWEGASSKLVKTIDGGATTKLITISNFSGFSSGNISCSNDGSIVAVSTCSRYLFISNDYGETFTKLTVGGTSEQIWRVWVSSDGNTMFANSIVTSTSKLYRSTDAGNTWTMIKTTSSTDLNSTSVDGIGGYLDFSDDGSVVIFGVGTVSLLVSKDSCSTWQYYERLPGTGSGLVGVACSRDGSVLYSQWSGYSTLSSTWIYH